MAIAGAGRGLGARLIAKWTVYPVRGVGPLRNENPRMGVRGSLGGGIGLLNRTMISGVPGFRIPISEFRFPNSEFRMAYGKSGIPHHENGDRGGGRGARAGGS